MAKMALAKLSVDEMMQLRDDVEQALTERSKELNRQLSMISGLGKTSSTGKRRGRPPKSAGARAAAAPKAVARKRGKVAPKFRSPAGDTWTGRGRQPRWLAAELKNGARLDDFRI